MINNITYIHNEKIQKIILSESAFSLSIIIAGLKITRDVISFHFEKRKFDYGFQLMTHGQIHS